VDRGSRLSNASKAEVDSGQSKLQFVSTSVGQRGNRNKALLLRVQEMQQSQQQGSVQ
jgi:hypothetical protein